MPSWRDVGKENLQAARHLLFASCFRGSVNRSYYAAYSVLTDAFAGRLTFGYGGNNPSHQDIPNLILNNLTALPAYRRREINAACRRLWKARVDADYVPTSLIDRAVAVSALRDSTRIFALLGVKDG
jgi:hypothetical protein